MTDQLYCPTCGPDWQGAYDMNHRCVKCGDPLRAEKVMEKLKAVEEERDDALARLYVMHNKIHEAFMMPVSVSPDTAESEELQDLRDLIGEAANQFEADRRIARIKAEWQAEALEALLAQYKTRSGYLDIHADEARRRLTELRRQASEKP